MTPLFGLRMLWLPEMRMKQLWMITMRQPQMPETMLAASVEVTVTATVTAEQWRFLTMYLLMMSS